MLENHIDCCHQDFGWDQVQKNLVLSSFFWGYVVTQIPSGYIAGVWSGQKLFAIGMFLCGVFNVIMPIVASKWSLPAVLVCRVGVGLSQACMLPCTHTLLSKWVPPSERARLGENVSKTCVQNILSCLQNNRRFMYKMFLVKNIQFVYF